MKKFSPVKAFFSFQKIIFRLEKCLSSRRYADIFAKIRDLSKVIFLFKIFFVNTQNEFKIIRRFFLPYLFIFEVPRHCYTYTSASYFKHEQSFDIQKKTTYMTIIFNKFCEEISLKNFLRKVDDF